MDYKDLIEEKITMVLPHCFETVIRHQNTIANLKGDIVECGVWKGGFSIFLAEIFKDKNIWVADSFEVSNPSQNLNMNIKMIDTIQNILLLLKLV